MSEKYVSTRIKAVGSAKAVQGLMHDTRFILTLQVPDRLQVRCCRI